jgi:hypothetical protein
MNTQPEALRLADELESEWFADYDLQNAVAELRRLHGVEKDRDDWKESTILANQRFKLAEEKLSGLHEQNQELLEALKEIARETYCAWPEGARAYRIAQAAIAKAEVTK